MKKFRIKQKSNRSGFTLVELVIVIAIVIILSVISVPIYRGYVDKSKMAEGYALLGTILSAQKAYYSEYGNFLTHKDSSGDTVYDVVLGIDGRSNKYFSNFWVGTAKSIDSKIQFEAGVYAKDELKGGIIKSRIFMVHNITSGTSFTNQ